MGAAANAVEAWYEAAMEAGTPVNVHTQLKQVLRQCLSDQAETAIAYIDDSPVVVALDGDRLICVRPEDQGVAGIDAVILVDSIPLGTPRRIGLKVSRQERSQGTYMLRTWTLGEVGALVLDTRTPVSPHQDGEYGGRELLERAAARLGWPLVDA
jgi:hypothetical protein